MWHYKYTSRNNIGRICRLDMAQNGYPKESLVFRRRHLRIIQCTKFCYIFEVLQMLTGTMDSFKNKKTNVDNNITLCIKFQRRRLFTFSFMLFFYNVLQQSFILSERHKSTIFNAHLPNNAKTVWKIYKIFL